MTEEGFVPHVLRYVRRSRGHSIRSGEWLIPDVLRRVTRLHLLPPARPLGCVAHDVGRRCTVLPGNDVGGAEDPCEEDPR